MSKQNNLNFKNSYEQRSRNSNPTSYHSRIRKLQNKKVLAHTDLSDLSDIIEKQHISVFGNLRQFFIKLRNQLILSYNSYQDLIQSSPHFKDSDFTAIPFSKYFDQSVSSNQIVFVQLYESFHKKFLFYQNKPISQFFVDKKTVHSSTSQKPHFDSFENTVISQDFPEAYALYIKLKQFVKNSQSHLLDQESIEDSLSKKNKQILVHAVIQQQHLSKTELNTSFQKCLSVLDPSVKLQDHEFYEIQSFIEKFKLQALLVSKKSPFLNHKKTQFKSVPIKCIGCAPIFYENEPIQRDRSSMTNFEVVKSVKDSKNYARLKQLVEAFMNSPNGGVILFDCDDYLFEVYPRGYEITLKNFEFRRQSIIDVCKHAFKDFEIDRDFTIDFVLLHDKDKNPIITTTQTEQGLIATEFFVTRLKVFGRKITSELKTNDDVESKKCLIDSKVVAYQVENKSLEPIDYQKMKMRFYKNENILKKINDPSTYKKIEKAFYKNKDKMSQLLRGRITPIHLHQNYGCKTSQMVSIDKIVSRKVENKSLSLKK